MWSRKMPTGGYGTYFNKKSNHDIINLYQDDQNQVLINMNIDAY